MYTQAQKDRLETDSYLFPIELLSDGDLLCVEEAPSNIADQTEDDNPFLSFILTEDGLLQGIRFHYRYHHAIDLPTGDRTEKPASYWGYEGTPPPPANEEPPDPLTATHKLIRDLIRELAETRQILSLYLTVYGRSLETAIADAPNVQEEK